MKKQSNGFTVIEVLITLTLIALIAVLTIPAVLYQTSQNNSLLKVKNMAQQLQSAATTYSQNNPNTLPTQASNISDLLNYTVKDTTDILTTGGPVCSAQYPCYEFADGGVLIPNMWDSDNNQGDYFYDPDGPGNKPALSLILQYNTFRVVSGGAYCAASQNNLQVNLQLGIPLNMFCNQIIACDVNQPQNCTAPTIQVDPAYIAPWVTGKS